MSGLFEDRGKIIHPGPRLIPSLWPEIFFIANTNTKIVHVHEEWQLQNAVAVDREYSPFDKMDNWRFGRIHQQWRKWISQHDHWAKIIGVGTTKVGTFFFEESKVGTIRDKQDYRRQRQERLYPSNSYISIGFSGRLHCPIFDSSFTFQATTRNIGLQLRTIIITT